MPCHHMQHVQNVGPNLFMCNENHAYVMPCVTHMCSDIMCGLHGACTQASWLPLCKHGVPEITYAHAICARQTIFIKIYCLTF